MWSPFQNLGLSVSCVFIFILFSHQLLSGASSSLYTSKKIASIGQGCHYVAQSNFIVKNLFQVTEEVPLPLGGTPPVVNEK